MSTHLSAEYAERSMHNAAGSADKPRDLRAAIASADVLCGVAILLADTVAFATSFLAADLALLGLHQVAGSLATVGPLPMPHQAAALRAGLLFIVVSAYLAGHGHFRDRLPFWNEMREVVLVSTFAAVANLALTALCWRQGPNLRAVNVLGHAANPHDDAAPSD